MQKKKGGGATLSFLQLQTHTETIRKHTKTVIHLIRGSVGEGRPAKNVNFRNYRSPVNEANNCKHHNYSATGAMQINHQGKFE